MFVIISIFAVLSFFYLLGKYEEDRRALFIRNVGKLFGSELAIQVNDKTKLLLQKEVDEHITHYELAVQFDGVIVERQRYVEGLNQNEPVSFKGPWNKDIQNALKREHVKYIINNSKENDIRLTTRKDHSSDEYLKYMNARKSIFS